MALTMKKNDAKPNARPVAMLMNVVMMAFSSAKPAGIPAPPCLSTVYHYDNTMIYN
jgi:hypothetical protein